MKNLLTSFIDFTALLVNTNAYSQHEIDTSKTSSAGWFSLGVRSTISLFDHDGTGLGTGGQFRIQLSNHVNTDWFVRLCVEIQICIAMKIVKAKMVV